VTITDIAARRGAKLVNANGIDIAYTELGDGPPLILLHGALISGGPAWAGSPVAYVDHMEALGKHFRVIAPDTRGSGATAHSGGPARFDILADDVVALIEALGLDRPLVAGFSEGGATATIVALRRPDVVRALVNHAGFDIFDPHAPAHQMVRPIFGGNPEATTADPDAAQQAFQSMPPMAAVFATMRADYDDAQGDGHWRTYLGQFFDRAIAPLGYSVEDFAAIAAPTLILTGDRDMFCPVEAACAAYRAVATGELGIVPNSGHEITPTAIELTTDFLLRHSARP
jgi:pimeloyl-ACP methyl ester carboxylesterase